ncbi:MAG TPA: response regulator transcription factor [Anaerolineales bacterium]|nr:response regulator transcription factor [Anaerolineales bacterium]
MLRIAIASSIPAMRVGLTALIGESGPGRVVVVGAVETALAAAEWVRAAAVDAVVYDLALESGGDAAGLAQLRRAAPRVSILALCEGPTDPRILAAIQAGARGCISRTATGADLLEALEDVAAGMPVLPPDSTATLLNQLRGDAPAGALSPREVEVLRGVAAGLTNKAIALRLGISEHTVKFHLGGAMTKLGASSRAEAVATALRQGWLAS